MRRACRCLHIGEPCHVNEPEEKEEDEHAKGALKVEVKAVL